MEVVVSDSFDVKGRTAIEFGATGVVAVFQAPSNSVTPRRGAVVLIVRPDGWMFRATIGEVKEHGENSRSAFMPDLSKDDVPAGARLRWGTDFWPADGQLAEASSHSLAASIKETP